MPSPPALPLPPPLPESPTSINIQRVGDASAGSVVARAGEEVELECAVSGGNPPSLIKWFAGDRAIDSGHRQGSVAAVDS